jgi:hypothetical protein
MTDDTRGPQSQASALPALPRPAAVPVHLDRVPRRLWWANGHSERASKNCFYNQVHSGVNAHDAIKNCNENIRDNLNASGSRYENCDDWMCNWLQSKDFHPACEGRP